MSKLITLDQLKTFADKIKKYVSAKSESINNKDTFSFQLPIPCFQQIVGMLIDDNVTHLLNSTICLLEDSSGKTIGEVINSGEITIDKVYLVDNENFFKIELSDPIAYMTTSSINTVDNSNTSSAKENPNIIIFNSSSNDSNVVFTITDADNNERQYPYNTTFNSIFRTGCLNHSVEFIVDNEKVSADGYNLSPNSESGNTTVYVKYPNDKVIATANEPGKIRIGAIKDGKKIPVELNSNNQAYVELDSGIFNYKGVFNGDYTTFLESDDCKNSVEGDVWTIKPEMSESGAEYVLVEKGDTSNWEYLGEKFTQAQVDWNETDESKPSFIKNKPTISGQTLADWNEGNTSSPSFIKNKPTFEQVQSDWNAEEGKGAILNKPSIKIGDSLIPTTSTESDTYYDITDKIQKLPVISKISELTENTLNITKEGTIFLINDTDGVDSQPITITIPEGSVLLTNNITLSEENKYTYSFTGKYVKIVTDVFSDNEISYYSVVTTELTKLGN